MNKGKTYYKIIIVVLCFASVLSFFLPFLHLPEQEGVETGYTYDPAKATLESNIIKDVAKETGVAKNIVYNTAKNICNGKDRQSIESRLKEEEYVIIDLLTERMNEKIAELESLGDLETRDYSYFGVLKLSASVIKYFDQDIISALLVIISLIMTVVLSYVSGFIMILKKGLESYKPVKILSLINIGLALVGLLSINAIGIGALQVDKFHTENWGIGFFAIAVVNFIILILAVIGSMHERWAGIVTFKMILRQKDLILMTIPFIIYVLIFAYGPLTGWTMAFQNYKPALSQQAWVAWDKFTYLLTEKDFLLAFRNTISMSLINLVFSFIFAIGFALLLNEVVNMKGKKFVQTISYLPHFLSWVIVASIAKNALSVDGGVINELLVSFGAIDSPINFFAESKYFWWIVGFSVVWKETGWNSIIYLASITAISPDLYEAASIDGAGRFKKMIHITLPGIKPTIFVLLIINLGMIMNSGFEAQLQLGNDIIKDTAEVIDTYVLKKSFFQGADFSLGTAAGIFRSVLSILLVSAANKTAKYFDQERLY